MSLLNGLIDWLGALDTHTIFIGVGALSFDLIPTMSYWGIGVLQAVVIISIIQLMSSWVRGFSAWPRNAPTYVAAFVLEALLFALLVFGLSQVLFGEDHGKLLGRGLAAWQPGLIVTAAVGILAVGGSQLARRVGSPAATRAFGIVAAVVFIAAIACAIVGIFGPVGLPDAEVAYLVIWVAFVVMYRLGMSRWKHWDSLERQIASETVADRPVNRWPAYLTSLALLLTIAAVSIAILGWAEWWRFMIALLVLAAGVATAAYIVGTAVSRGRRDLYAAPDPVETATRA